MPRIVDITGYQRQAEALRGVGRSADVLVSRAVSTLLRRLPVEARRDIQAEYNLPARRISSYLSARRGDGYVELVGQKRGIGLINFGGRWGGRKTEGAVATVRNSEGASVYGGTFIATLLHGNRQIVERETKKRFPLRTLYGPSIAQMLRNAARRERLADYAQGIGASEMDRLAKGTKKN
ncbi:MAG: phage tail protein [Dokdonella sp.]|uniref:phage tail protein n=1 Tax=Dokdonella sp. TaxID=2291710 RepID=UPI003F7F9184